MTEREIALKYYFDPPLPENYVKNYIKEALPATMHDWGKFWVDKSYQTSAMSSAAVSCVVVIQVYSRFRVQEFTHEGHSSAPDIPKVRWGHDCKSNTKHGESGTC